MAKVFFTANLRRHVDCASMEAEGGTVRDVLSQVFAAQDRLGSYVLDDQGALRKHMSILVDGQRIRDLERLSDVRAFTGVDPQGPVRGDAERQGVGGGRGRLPRRQRDPGAS